MRISRAGFRHLNLAWEPEPEPEVPLFLFVESATVGPSGDAQAAINWDDARAACISLGTELASIHSEARECSCARPHTITHTHARLASPRLATAPVRTAPTLLRVSVKWLAGWSCRTLTMDGDTMRMAQSNQRRWP